MPILTYHSTLIDGIHPGAYVAGPYSTSDESSINTADTFEELSAAMSSQIFLSRGVAGSDEPAAVPATNRQTTVASIFESNSSHIMTLGDAAASTVSSQRGSAEESLPDNGPSKMTSCDSRGSY